MKIHSMICATALLLGGVVRSADCQPNPADSARVWRESLRAADANASTAAFKTGLAGALSSTMTDDAVSLWDAAPIVSGRAGVQQLLSAQRSVRAVSSTKSPQDPFAAADIAFARMAIDSGAPAAFYHYSAPDGMTFAGTGELNIGPDAIRARLAEGAAGKAKWVWRPVITLAAPSGDLGVTIGTAEIQLGSGPNDVFFSKYLSIWKRQPDGSIKFVADGGSGRPQTP